MVPGYIVGQTAVQLGLTATTTGFADTDLVPTGYARPAADIQFTAGLYPNPVPEPGLAWAALAAAIGLGFAWQRCRNGARSAIAVA